MAAEPESIFDEIAPDLNGTKASEDPHICPECGQRFDGPMWGARLGGHRRNKHGIVGTRRDRGKPPPATDGAPGESRAPELPKRPRKNLSELGTQMWRGAAWVSARCEKMAASRMFGLLAPAAGPAVDRAVKGTFFDRLLQPLARAGDQGKDAMILIGAPLTAQAFLETPNVFTQAAFVGSLEASLPIIVKTAKDAKRRQEKMEQDLSDMAEVFGKQPGEKVTTREVALWVLTGSTVEAPAEPTVGEEAVA